MYFLWLEFPFVLSFYFPERGGEGLRRWGQTGMEEDLQSTDGCRGVGGRVGVGGQPGGKGRGRGGSSEDRVEGVTIHRGCNRAQAGRGGRGGAARF